MINKLLSKWFSVIIIYNKQDTLEGTLNEIVSSSSDESQSLSKSGDDIKHKCDSEITSDVKLKQSSSVTNQTCTSSSFIF